MSLEKVTARNSEASLAGWIASNDATLFTMVLVVVIAIFLHSKLSSGARENVQLRKAQESSTDQLRLTQEERDQLQQQLTGKLDRIAQLMTQLDAVTAAKEQMEAAHKSLASSTEALTNDKAALAKANASLQQRLDEISRQLSDRLAAMSDIETQRDRLKIQADELDAIVAGLRQELDAANVDLSSERTRATVAQTAAESKIGELESQLVTGERQADEYLTQLKQSAELLRSVSTEKKQLQTALAEAEQQRQSDLLQESRNNRELVGLAGRLERVAILFDASGSMRQAAAGGAGDRWAEAQEIAATWLNHLNVHRCVLIVFAADVRTFPTDGSLADLRGDGGNNVRASLLRQLKAVTPGGLTNTLAALHKAYEYDIDTILLFSDGAPSMAETGFFDPAIANRIYQLCGQHENIPVNAIGLGNYFDTNMSTFLRTVASKTGGTFRGQ